LKERARVRSCVWGIGKYILVILVVKFAVLLEVFDPFEANIDRFACLCEAEGITRSQEVCNQIEDVPWEV
jgi:hypothetical protein